MEVGILYLNFSKAFDTVDHEILSKATALVVIVVHTKVHLAY